MRAIIIGDQQAKAEQMSTLVVRHGYECGPNDVWTSRIALKRSVNPDVRLILLQVTCPTAEMVPTVNHFRTVAEHARIVVVGPAKDSKFILSILREGADEFVDENDLTSELESTLLRLREKGTPQPQGRIIAVLGASGGCGASTIAANLGSAWAHPETPPVLVDLCTAGDLNLLLDLKVRYTWTSLCEGYERMDGSMLQQALVSHSDGFRLLGAPQSIRRVESINPDAVVRMLGLLQASFQRSVVEVDRYFYQEQIPVISNADVVLLVMRLDMASLHHAQQILDQLDSLAVKLDRVRIVVNRSGQPKELPSKRAEDVLQSPICHFVPDDAARMNLAVNKGVTVVKEKPHSRVARSMRQLAEKVASLEMERPSRALDTGLGHWQVPRVAVV